jgi:hypothetical protein
MELLEGEILRRRVLKSYTKNPKGWDFVISPSPKSGFYDAVISGPEETWMLKIDSLFKPYPTILGSPTEIISGLKPASPFPYGFRRLPREMLLQSLDEETGQPRNERVARLMAVLGLETVVPEEGRSYAQGPFVLTNPGKVGLSENQKELGERLTSEMRRFLRIRYPAYG